jgi:hypothetical protein
MLTSAAAITAMTHMLVRRTFSLRLLALLGAALGVGLATRATMFFTLLALIVGAAAALTVTEIRALVPWRRIAIAFGAVLLVVAPWASYRGIVQHQGPLNETSRLLHAALHPTAHPLSDSLTSHRPFFTVFEPQVFTSPWRSNFKNEALPQTYTEIWGDWFGTFAWSENVGPPNNAAQRVLKDQSYIGLVPTALAILGWLGLALVAFWRRRDLAVLGVMPLIGVGGYLYRSWVSLTHDGDLFKATYALNTVTVWALGFALATTWLGSRSRMARYAMGALFVAFAILEFQFTLYGVRNGHAIF